MAKDGTNRGGRRVRAGAKPDPLKGKLEAGKPASRLIEAYAQAFARYIQCEEAISKFGLLGKHPTTGAAIASPFVAMNQSFSKQVNVYWYEIYEIVRAISTHPHAWAQCRGWVHQNLPEAVYVAGTSTSAPARALATTEGDTGFQAVLCNPLAAEQYGLEVIAGGVADNPDAVTRFVKVTRPGRVGEPTGADKTTLLVHLPHDRSGALLDMLEQFSARGVNLSRIESRPVGDSLGRYRFSIDVEGHVREERVQAALIGLHRTCPVVRFLGSYPRLDARPTAVLAGTSDKDFVVARSWVADVLDGRAL